MSLMRWFSRARPAEALSTLPPREGRESGPPSRRNERLARREQLYTVIRECMVRSGILSSGYRFKVLSLDGRGRQFMVMVDLIDAPDGSTSRLTKVESEVIECARTRHGLMVKSVYWRQHRTPARAVADAAVKPMARRILPPTPMPPINVAEPLQQEELAAFRSALAQGTAPAAANGGPRSYTLLTGFEDTEAADERTPGLSTTQYGELR